MSKSGTSDQAQLPSLDPAFLQRELDKTKSRVFLSRTNAAFLGSLMCSLDFHWDESIDTAATDGVSLFWNPHFFLKLTPEARRTVLLHELWHPARLHLNRIGSRHPKIWNIACDHRINLDLEDEGCSFEGVEWAFKDKKYKGWVEEDIYDDIYANAILIPVNYVGDLKPSGSKQDKARAINNVVRAATQAKMGNQAGSMPGDIEELLKIFLTPIVPWQQVLHRFMQDLVQETYSWRRPNRRFMAAGDLYLPSPHMDEGKLEHLVYYLDVSGSITSDDIVRFNSEVKHIHEVYQPKRLTLIQFDTQIQQVKELVEGDPFTEVQVKGRGGTCLKCVHADIVKRRPTAAIIFTDLCVAPMERLPFEVPVVWIAIRNPGAHVPFGQVIHIR